MNIKLNSPGAPRMAVIVSMVNGLESFVKRETEELVKRGYKLRLFATKYNPSLGFEPEANIPFQVSSFLSVFFGVWYWVLRKPILVIIY